METWNEYRLWHWSYYTMQWQIMEGEMHVIVAERLQYFIRRVAF